MCTSSTVEMVLETIYGSWKYVICLCRNLIRDEMKIWKDVLSSVLTVLLVQDKWRNLSESRILKNKPNEDTPATPVLVTQASASSTPAAHDAPVKAIEDGSSKCSPDEKAVSKLVSFFLCYRYFWYDNYVYSKSLNVSLLYVVPSLYFFKNNFVISTYFLL